MDEGTVMKLSVITELYKPWKMAGSALLCVLYVVIEEDIAWSHEII